jgi:membrane protease subunit HflC
MKKKLLKGLLAAVAVLLIICVSSSFYVVRENEYASTVRFSKIIKTVESAGLYFKVPFIDNIRTFPKAIMIYDISPSEVLTSDKQNLTVDSYVLWRISDPLLFFQTLGSTTVAEERLDALTYNALKNVMGTLAQRDIINEEVVTARNDIYEGITNNVSRLALNYGIEVVDVKIIRLDLPISNEQAVYSRMISERNQIAEKYAADGEYEASIIRNNVDKKVNIIVSNAQAKAAALEAEGEAEYMRMMAEAYNTPDRRSFYEFMLALDALKASLSGEEKTVILGKDSVLAQLLLNP